MSTTSKTVRLPADLAEELEFQAARQRRSFSSVVEEYLRETIAARRYPHVIFRGPPESRRAHLLGTGLDVWEIALLIESAGGESDWLPDAYPGLTVERLAEALRYIGENHDEIGLRLELNRRWGDERLVQTLPAPLARDPHAV